MFLEKLAQEQHTMENIPRFHIEEEMWLYNHQIQRQQFPTELPQSLTNKIESRKKETQNKGQNVNNQIGNPQNDNQHNNNQNNSNQTNNNQNNNAYSNRGKRGGNTRGQPAKNTNVKDSWRLPANKQLHQCFYAEARRTNPNPKVDDKEFCLRYHILGDGVHGTSCCNSHRDPRKAGLEKEFDTFCKKAYS
jgi:hypothetical protein